MASNRIKREGEQTRPVLDRFQDCCKDGSWNWVIVFMVVIKVCYGYYVIQSSNNNNQTIIKVIKNEKFK